MQEHPLIELYMDTGDEQQDNEVEQLLSSKILDEVVQRTLQAANISQQVMLTLLITNDEGIKEMNQQYRQQNKPTDVLSFPLLDAPIVEAPAELLWVPREQEGGATGGEGSEETPEFVNPPGQVLNLGDIIMSWATVQRQAKEAGHSILYEVLYLLSHGVLHLIGYDDQTEAGYQAMVGMQEAVLRATRIEA